MRAVLPTSKTAALRLLLALLLILPVPLLWETATAYATRDYYNVPSWLGGIMVYSTPLMTLIGAMLLPLRIRTRIALAVLLVPLAIVVEVFWGLTYVCRQFGDCV